LLHEKHASTLKNRAAMIRTTSSKQLTIAEFDWPFESTLDKNNRWVKLSDCIPWDELAESYYQGLPADRGRPLPCIPGLANTVIANRLIIRQEPMIIFTTNSSVSRKRLLA
jgi:hypothetical protein